MVADEYTNSLGISLGDEVQVARQGGPTGKLDMHFEALKLKLFTCTDLYSTFALMPRPPKSFQVQGTTDERVYPRCIHFLDKGTKLVVSYLHHGIVYFFHQTTS